MARASHKIDLVNDAKLGYKELLEMVESFSKEEQEGTFPFEDRDKNIRDVLVHLHEWHNMMLDWYKIGCIEKGIPVIPREGYTWKTLPQMNQMIWQMYQNTSLEEAKKLLEQTHKKELEIIETLSNEDLFLRGQYPWTNDTTLGSIFVSSTASHYEWAMTKIKKYKRELKKIK